MNFLPKFILFLAISFSYIFAAPPPDNSFKGAIKPSQSVKIYLDDVDDVGLAMLWNANGANTIAQCEWNSGVPGSDRREISHMLTRGDNYIIFALYNKVYVGFGLFAGGKYSYDFSLDIDEKEIWRSTKTVRENTMGIKYWKVIRLNVSKDGKITASDSIPDRILRQLQGYMTDVEYKLNQNANVAVPF